MVKQAVIRAVDNAAATKWTRIIGDENQNPAETSYSVGYSVIQVSLKQKTSSTWLQLLVVTAG